MAAGPGRAKYCYIYCLVPNLTNLTFNNSGNSLSKLTTNDIFEILSLSWFQNYPWMLDLVKKWLRYWWLKRRLQFPNRPSLSIQVAAARAPRGEVYLGWASLPRHSATEFLLVGPMHKRRETYQNRRASPLCFGNFFLSGKVLYQCAVFCHLIFYCIFLMKPVLLLAKYFCAG